MNICSECNCKYLLKQHILYMRFGFLLEEIAMKNITTLKIVTAIALTLGFASAQAVTMNATGTAMSTSLSATAAVTGSCSAFTSAGGFPFTAYASNSATPVDATTTVSATCTSGTPYTMAISAGSHLSSGTWGGYRALIGSAGGYLSYSVTVATPAGAFWGDGVNGGLGAVLGATGTGAAQTFTVSGRIMAGQVATVGTYSDTVVASLTY
jgi:spore coat protein U-like protein